MAAPPPGPKAGSRGTPPPVPKAATPTPVPKAAAAETSAAGLRFGGGPPVMENYDSMRKIGRGNYGTVYLARDTRNGKHYCLKQIQMETYSAEERANAQQEVEVLRTLDHPGIVRYREHFLHGDSLCVVMTYCEGGDLAATIKRRAKKEDNFTEAEVLDWFVQLVMALHHVHSKKILHRELKTQNIFITKNLVKLGGFGIAKVMEGSMSAASTVIGTPYYMSPEVCQNQPYSYKSDVWALGCILYEMCALQQARSTRHAHAAHAARTPRATRARRVRTPRTHAAHARRARTHARCPLRRRGTAPTYWASCIRSCRRSTRPSRTTTPRTCAGSSPQA